jgi:hypothetical protein
MPTKVKEKKTIAVKRFITDEKGKKLSAIIDIKELERMKELLEDIEDLRVIEERKDEPVADFEEYLRKRKTRSRVSA